MRVITSCIHKGGTGKTTCAVHLVHHLAHSGKRVLLVDCDTQGNATQAFMDERLDEGGVSALFGNSSKSKRYANSVKLHDAGGGVHVMPADHALIDIERMPVGAEKKFRTNLRAIAEANGFDYVVIDTPPTMGFAMLAPLVASDFAFSPIVPDPYGITGVKSLLKRVDQVRDQYNKNLRYLGLLINRYNRRSAEQTQVVEAMEQDLADNIIPHRIGERVAIARVAFSRAPVWSVRSGAGGVAAREMRGALNWIVNNMEDAANG